MELRPKDPADLSIEDLIDMTAGWVSELQLNSLKGQVREQAKKGLEVILHLKEVIDEKKNLIGQKLSFKQRMERRQ